MKDIKWPDSVLDAGGNELCRLRAGEWLSFDEQARLVFTAMARALVKHDREMAKQRWSIYSDGKKIMEGLSPTGPKVHWETLDNVMTPTQAALDAGRRIMWEYGYPDVTREFVTDLYEAMSAAMEKKPKRNKTLGACPVSDPHCPCNFGDACRYG